MMNRVTLIGNLGRDPELRYTPAGDPVVKLSLATSRRYKDRRDTVVEEVEWHRVTVWGKQAEHCNAYLTKGRQVCVEGRLRTSSYDKDGQKHFATEIVAERVIFLGGGSAGGSAARGSAARGSAAGAEWGPDPAEGAEGDDIPF